MHNWLSALFYGSILIFVLGITYQIIKWWMIPHRYPLTRFPSVPDNGRAMGRVIADTLLFRSMWRRSMEVWVSGFLLHWVLLLVLVGHYLGINSLGREFVSWGLSAEQSVAWSAYLGLGLGMLLLAVLLYLLGRRLFSSRLRQISFPEDYGVLLLLLAITVSGNLMRLTGGVDSAGVRDFMQGLLVLRPAPVPQNSWFIMHFVLVNGLLLYFPFSKLLHSCGSFMSRWLITRTYPRQV